MCRRKMNRCRRWCLFTGAAGPACRRHGSASVADAIKCFSRTIKHAVAGLRGYRSASILPDYWDPFLLGQGPAEACVRSLRGDLSGRLCEASSTPAVYRYGERAIPFPCPCTGTVSLRPHTLASSARDLHHHPPLKRPPSGGMIHPSQTLEESLWNESSQGCSRITRTAK